jgi:type I restriction enzyme S subunit
MVPKNILPARVNQHVMIVRAKENSNLSFYFLCSLCFPENKNKLLGISQAGSTREAITKSEIEDFRITVPDSNSLKHFESAMKILFNRKELKSKENQKLEDMQSVLLSKLGIIE